jgi:hypothetical protein
MRPVRLSLAAVLVALFGAACTQTGSPARESGTPSPRPAGPARLTILAPANGGVIHGSTVQLKVRLPAGTAVKPTTGQNAPGYLHVYLDDQIVSITLVPLNQKAAAVAIHHVTRGRHRLQAELVASNHLPLQPPVIAAVTFVVNR